MDVLLRRCPFLARVPQAFLQQTKSSLMGYAQRCPIMMELASKPMAPSMARALCSSSSSSSYQNAEDTMSASEGEGDKEEEDTYFNIINTIDILYQVKHPSEYND